MELVRIKWKWEFCTTLSILRFHFLMKLKINALWFDCGGALDIGWWFLLFNSVMRRKCHSLIGIEKLLYFILLCLTLVFVLKHLYSFFIIDEFAVIKNRTVFHCICFIFQISDLAFISKAKICSHLTLCLYFDFIYRPMVISCIYSDYFYAILMNLLRNDKIGRHNKIWFASCIISPALLATLQISGINILLLSTEN